MIVTYINSETLIEDIEAVMKYHGLRIIEQNKHYRVFSGNFNGSALHLAEKLNIEFTTVDFDIEDSIFIVYPTYENNRASISNLVIKRKGNKYLRMTRS